MSSSANMSASSRSATPIVVIGAYPPPVNGYTVITSTLEMLLRERRETIAIDISPGTTRRGLVYHARRSSRVLVAVFKLFAIRTRGRFETYIATESRAGLAYTLILAGLAGAMGSRVFLHHHGFRYIDQRSRLMAAIVSVTRGTATHIFLCDCMRRSFGETYRRPPSSTILSNLAFTDIFTCEPPPRDYGEPFVIGLLSNPTRYTGLSPSC